MRQGLESQVVISSCFDELIESLKLEAKESGVDLILILREGNFRVEDVMYAIDKAYLASDKRQVIVLGADNFGEVVQNKLLKIIEEPPKNKSFILLFHSKASVLPTIRSRLPINIIRDNEKEETINLDVKNLSMQVIYDFLQDNRRLNSLEAKNFVEYLLKETLKTKVYLVDQELLDTFTKSIKALDRGSPVSFVLTSLLLKLFSKRKKY